MKSFKCIILFLIFWLSCLLAVGQEKSKVFKIKKGEVLDLLYLNTKPEVDALLDQYFKTAFPVAGKHGYTPLGGLAVKETPIQGNYHPEVLAFGKWPSEEDRIVALSALETEVEGFHQMRRAIWSTFNVVYFELQEDLKIEISPERYYVVTNLWKKGNAAAFQSYLRSWESKVDDMKGSILINLKDGKAPFGYRFTPDYVSITAWESKAEFEKFLEISKKMDRESLQHINQFRVE